MSNVAPQSVEPLHKKIQTSGFTTTATNTDDPSEDQYFKLEDLPNEIILLILDHLDYSTIAKILPVSRRIYNLGSRILNLAFRRISGDLESRWQKLAQSSPISKTKERGLKHRFTRIIRRSFLRKTFRGKSRLNRPLKRPKHIVYHFITNNFPRARWQFQHVDLIAYVFRDIQATFERHVKLAHCCYAFGKIFDDALRDLRYIEQPNVMHKATECQGHFFPKYLMRLITSALQLKMYYHREYESRLPNITRLRSAKNLVAEGKVQRTVAKLLKKCRGQLPELL